MFDSLRHQLEEKHTNELADFRSSLSQSFEEGLQQVCVNHIVFNLMNLLAEATRQFKTLYPCSVLFDITPPVTGTRRPYRSLL